MNALGEHFDQIDVITMHKGRLALRDNICVYSVGGELGYSKIKKARNFYILLIKILNEKRIDGCFTHMAVWFMLIGGPLLMLKRIPRVTWYAHSVLNPVMLGAYVLSNAIVTASQDSFRINSRKVHVTGHGIDTNHYSRKFAGGAPVFTIGSVGRISRVKNYEVLFHAIKLLKDDGFESFQVKLYGNIQTKDDRYYSKHLESLINELNIDEKVQFLGSLTSGQVPEIVPTFDVFVNMLSRGGAGKAVLEAMSMEVPTIICTPAFDSDLSQRDRNLLLFRPDDPASLKSKLMDMMQLSFDKRDQIGKRLRKMVMARHSLDRLPLKIKQLIQRAG
ncbi:glycosyltransferase family 4 protein [Thermodesulfobacteriota bacterium]